jgi:rhodanese-related sulfurtransferase
MPNLLPGSGIAIFLSLVLLISPLAAEEVKTPDTIKGSVLVSAEDLIDLVDRIPNLIVIDSRIPGDRKQGYIEGSVSLPDVDTTCETLKKQIPKTDLPILFYCNGVKCGRSAKAVKIALSCGYNNIYWFRGGFKEWLAKGFPYLQE